MDLMHIVLMVFYDERPQSILSSAEHGWASSKNPSIDEWVIWVYCKHCVRNGLRSQTIFNHQFAFHLCSAPCTSDESLLCLLFRKRKVALPVICDQRISLRQPMKENYEYPVVIAGDRLIPKTDSCHWHRVMEDWMIGGSAFHFTFSSTLIGAAFLSLLWFSMKIMVIKVKEAALKLNASRLCNEWFVSEVMRRTRSDATDDDEQFSMRWARRNQFEGRSMQGTRTDSGRKELKGRNGDVGEWARNRWFYG